MDSLFPDPDTRNVLEPGCNRCPSLVDARERIAWGNGPVDASILVVGEAPGAGTPDAEKWQGGNWTGLAYTAQHSGRIIRSLLADIGYGPNTCYLTNAVKCFPRDTDGSNREPTDEERTMCFTHLKTELTQIDPSVVIATGRLATETILNYETIDVDQFTDIVLEPYACPRLGVSLVPIFHPAYQHVWLSRTGYTTEEYKSQLATILKTLLQTD